LERFQEYFDQYKIVVYTGLNCDSIMYERQVETSDRFNLLFDDTTRHYHVIGSLTGAMAKQFVCKACGKGLKEAQRIHVIRHVAIAWRVLHVCRQGFESLAWTVIGIFVAR
jgi:hypothetical protein